MKNTTRKKTKPALDVIQLRVEFGEKNVVLTTLPYSKALAEPSALKAAIKAKFPTWTVIHAEFPEGDDVVLTNRRAKK